MQKKLIALAVAGLVSGAAFAQATNVTVYGVIDQNYTYSKNGDLKFSGLTDGGMSGSRIGFRGTEALGNGLDAIFQAEFGFSADSTRADSAFFNRQTFVGLKSKTFGTAIAGKFDSVSRDLLSKGYASDVTQMYPANVAMGDQGGAGAFLAVNTGDRVDNGVKWISPNWNGLELRAHYGFGEVVGTVATPGDTSDNQKYGLGARYNNGPIDVVAAYSVIDETSNVAAGKGNGKIDGWSIGGAYDFKVVKVFASYQEEDDDRTVIGDTVNKDAWGVGVRVPVGKATTLIAEYTKFKATGDTFDDIKTDGWGIGFEHMMSKRTTLYGGYSQIDNDEGSAAAFGGADMRKVFGEKAKAFQVGVRHTF